MTDNEHILEILEILRDGADTGDRDQFRIGLCTAKSWMGLSDLDLASSFQVSLPTIGRWMSGA